MFIRAPFNYDRNEASVQAGVDCNVDEVTGEIIPSKTQQSFKEECDINEIVRRFGITGQLPENYRAPVSGDFTGISDYHSALNAVIAADAEFMKLDASIRERFNNDPAALIEFIENKDNIDEARKLGIVDKIPEVTRDVVQAVDELAAKILPVK